SVVNIDAAIVRLEDTHFWDAQTIDKPLGTVADFSADTASLSWIGWPVVAHGAASGEMCGEIKAIFYRYKSVGGRDYVADFVIGSRSDKPLVTQPGDSGALWCIDGVFQENTLSPVAIEWGGQRVTSGADADTGFLQLSLSTSMAVILRELSLDVVQDPAAERTQYWGPVGHYKIGQQACFLISDQNLRNFFTANLSDISFTTDQQIQTATHLQAAEFVPLSDVPDVVWKTNINRVKREVTRPMENWNHYADIDLPGADGKTLLEHYLADESSVDWSQWTGFYKTAPLPSASTQTSNSWGALPFRVWQIFASMVDFARSGDGASFLTAAGCLAHYIGDACQPLHGSQHSDGLNGATTGVHSTYEDNMVDAFADQIAAGFDSAVANLSFRPREIHTPRDAAMTIMDLMNFCHTVLPPEKICEVYNQARPGLHKSATKSSQVLDALWAQCGQETIEVIAAGAVTLAAVWQAAYSASGQSDTAGWLSETFDGTRDLMPIYEEQDFLRSLHLEFLGQSDLPGSDAPDQPPTPPPAGPSTAGTNPVHLDDRGHRAGGAAVPTKAPKSRTAKTPIPGARKSVKRPSKTTHRTAGRD
ncbi:MAG: hypothetical protein H0X25_10860, partial [Acidobacteriales bacterium]|nr:hypothetical protein [Terriglobales bacterium]